MNMRNIFLNSYYDRPDTSADWTSGPSEDLLGDADDEDLADQLLSGITDMARKQSAKAPAAILISSEQPDPNQINHPAHEARMELDLRIVNLVRRWRKSRYRTNSRITRQVTTASTLLAYRQPPEVCTVSRLGSWHKDVRESNQWHKRCDNNWEL